MKYINSTEFSHQQADKIGVLITNLGTPAAPTKKALRPYLKQFLSDPRIVEIPRLIWWCILNLVILNFRPARSAKAYAGVWSEEGSPLMKHTQDTANALQTELSNRFGDDVIVEFAMRYGEPSINKAIQTLADKGARKLFTLPLYPQYSATTTASTFDAIAEDFTQRRWIPDFRFLNHYNDHPKYIAAIADSIRAHREESGSADLLLFSFHGIPKRYLHNGDPYHCECYKTARLVAEQLGLEADAYKVVFQSRFGREEWLQPYCDETLKGLPAQGVKSVQVICPGFAADCLETIEEIDEENREYFMEAGGEQYQYIPALNSSPAHIDLLADLVCENTHGWQVTADENRQQRATACGAEK